MQRLFDIFSTVGDSPEPYWLTVDDIAKELKISKSIVYRLIRNGDIKAIDMVESNGKKCTFMRQVIRETGANAVVHQCRIEDMPPFDADIVTSRALASMELLMAFAQPFIGKNTEIWLLKGQDVDEELTKSTISRNIPIVRYKSKTDPNGVILQIKC